MLKRLFNRGDTIVEVMLVLAVLGLAISICYATANRSLLNARQAQESAQATVMLQSEIEDMYSMANSGNISGPSSIFQANPFCIAPGQVVDPASSGSCNMQTPDRSPSIAGIYNLSIQYPDNGATPGATFQLMAVWPDVEGQGQDSATMYYQIYP